MGQRERGRSDNRAESSHRRVRGERLGLIGLRLKLSEAVPVPRDHHHDKDHADRDPETSLGPSCSHRLGFTHGFNLPGARRQSLKYGRPAWEGA
ncbi:hypothetical protein ACFPRL_36045 [Pseudoclavibacter helvolus]